MQSIVQITLAISSVIIFWIPVGCFWVFSSTSCVEFDSFLSLLFNNQPINQSINQLTRCFKKNNKPKQNTHRNKQHRICSECQSRRSSLVSLESLQSLLLVSFQQFLQSDSPFPRSLDPNCDIAFPIPQCSLSLSLSLDL